jgi:LacI family transcriptional regulator
MTVRMKDIAKDLGVSIVTVSKVIRNHPDIAEETRERVLKRVRELDYQPNVLARSLVTGRSYLIGLVVPDLLHPFFCDVAKSLSTVIGKKGYSLIIAWSEEDPALEAREILQLVGRQLDALVIASSEVATDSFERLDRQGQRYLLIDREFPELSANFVGIDDEAAGRIATEHLVDQGCKTIAHIRGPNVSTGNRRLVGYQSALARRGLAYSDRYVVPGSRADIGSSLHGAAAMRRLLEQSPIPDGVFCFNDPLAIGAMNAILEAGLRIPEDVAVVGCGNLHYDGSLRVPLSSVDQNSQMIGEHAGKILLNLIESKNRPPPVKIVLDPELVIRASSKRDVGAKQGGLALITDVGPKHRRAARKQKN